MLERLPTELISLVIDATSTGAWERKALLDSLSLVSKSYRIALRPLRESIVHVPRADVIPTLRSWPPARRKAVVTVTVGTDDHAQALEPFNLRDYSRLLSILPHVKHVYVRRVQESHYYNFLNSLSYQQMWFEMISSNPFRRAFTAYRGSRVLHLCTDTHCARQNASRFASVKHDGVSHRRWSPPASSCIDRRWSPPASSCIDYGSSSS